MVGKECPRKLLDRWNSFINGISSSDTPPKSRLQHIRRRQVLSNSLRLIVRARKSCIAKGFSRASFYPDKGAKNNGIDGVYGPKTANAVKRFQLMNGLTADGIYGPKTKASLNRS